MNIRFPKSGEIGPDEAKLMVDLGADPYSALVLLREAGYPIPNWLLSSKKATSSKLSPVEEEILRAGGASGLENSEFEIRAAEHEMALLTLDECRALLEQCHELEFVAKQLQISPESALALAKSEYPRLLAFRLGDDGPWLFPCWQFCASGSIPSLDRVLSEAPQPPNPLILSNLMLYTSIDLEVGDETMSPHDWLIHVTLTQNS